MAVTKFSALKDERNQTYNLFHIAQAYPNIGSSLKCYKNRRRKSFHLYYFFFFDYIIKNYSFQKYIICTNCFCKQTNGFASTPANFKNGNQKNTNKLNSQSSEKKKPEPFRRVRTEEVEIDERVKDMSFEAKVSASNEKLKKMKWNVCKILKNKNKKSNDQI